MFLLDSDNDGTETSSHCIEPPWHIWVLDWKIVDRGEIQESDINDALQLLLLVDL